MATQKTISTYRDVFKRAYQIIKQNKFLWVFGLFTAVLGAGGEFEPLMKSYTTIADTTSNVFSIQALFRGGLLGLILDNIGNFFSNYPVQAILFILVVVLVAVILLWLAIISEVAIFGTVDRLAKNQKSSLAEGFKVGNKFLLPAFIVNIVARAMLYVLFLILVIPLASWFILNDSVIAGVIFLLVIFFIYIPVSIIVSFIMKYAVAYVVLEGKKVGEAFRLGWELFKNNWLVSVEMALLVLLFGVVTGVIILVAIGLAAIPFILIGIVAYFFNSVTTFNAVLVVGTFVWIIIAAFIGSMYVAYQYAAWTLLFKKLVDEKAESKITRLFNKILPAANPKA